MKKTLISIILLSFFLSSCGNNEELENLKKENAALTTQVKALKVGTNAKGPKYMLKLRLKQSHLSLSIKKHIKDAVNAIEFELPVDKEFYDSVSEGTEIIDKFRFGSMVLYGSLGDWEMTVKEKYVK
jgi:PBP1b-binding outer membrane lipoprotein LpoB